MPARTGAQIHQDEPIMANGHVVAVAAMVTGGALIAEAVVSPLVDSHVGYHALNVVLNAALVVVAHDAARAGRQRVGMTGVIGGWGTTAMAMLAATGGLWTLLAEGVGSSETPGVVEGITHTAVLLSFLFLVPLGLGLRRQSPTAGTVIAGASAALVAMVLIGLDSPTAFAVPEGVLGAGWVLYGRSMRTTPASRERVTR